MDRLIDKIFEYHPELANHLFGPVAARAEAEGQLVVAVPRELELASSLDLHCGSPASPVGCSPGPRGVFVELGPQPMETRLCPPISYGWLFVGQGPRPGVFEQVRASLVVDYHRLIVGPEAVLEFGLDEAGRILGWPQFPSHGWMTASSARNAVGDGHILHLLYPALVALERVTALGDSIRVQPARPSSDAFRRSRGWPPLFPCLVPTPRPR